MVSAGVKLIALCEPDKGKVFSPCPDIKKPSYGFTFCLGRTPDIESDILNAKSQIKPFYIYMECEYSRSGIYVEDLPSQQAIHLFSAKANFLSYLEDVFFNQYFPNSGFSEKEAAVMKKSKTRKRYYISTNSSFIDFLHEHDQFKHLSAIVWEGEWGSYCTVYDTKVLNFESAVCSGKSFCQDALQNAFQLNQEL